MQEKLRAWLDFWCRILACDYPQVISSLASSSDFINFNYPTCSTTALGWAVEKGDEQLFTIFVDHGADVDIPVTCMGDSPLTIAVKNNRYEFVCKLLAAGANPNHIRKDFASPLSLAILQNNHDIWDKLIAFSANVHYEHNGINWALYTALLSGNTVFSKELLSLGVKEDILCLLLYRRYTHLKHYFTKKNIINKNINVPWMEEYGFVKPIHIAVDLKDVQLVEFLLKNGSEIDSKSSAGWNSLDILIENNIKNISNVLSSVKSIQSAEKSIRPYESYLKERYTHPPELWEVLVNSGAEPGIYGLILHDDIRFMDYIFDGITSAETFVQALTISAKYGKISCLHALCSNKAEISSVTPVEWDTILSTAIIYMQYAVTDYLMPYVYLSESGKALHLAVSFLQDSSLAEKLLNCGADGNYLLASGASLFSNAVDMRVSFEILEALLKNNANPNVRDGSIYQLTALHRAAFAYRDRFDSFIELCENYGVDTDVQDSVFMQNARSWHSAIQECDKKLPFVI